MWLRGCRASAGSVVIFYVHKVQPKYPESGRGELIYIGGSWRDVEKLTSKATTANRFTVAALTGETGTSVTKPIFVKVEPRPSAWRSWWQPVAKRFLGGRW